MGKFAGFSSAKVCSGIATVENATISEDCCILASRFAANRARFERATFRDKNCPPIRQTVCHGRPFVEQESTLMGSGVNLSRPKLCDRPALICALSQRKIFLWEVFGVFYGTIPLGRPVNTAYLISFGFARFCPKSRIDLRWRSRFESAGSADGRSVGRSLVRTWNLIIRVGCALVVCRISGTGIRQALLRSVWIMNDKGRYHSLKSTARERTCGSR
jgi:hypothetical protein